MAKAINWAEFQRQEWAKIQPPVKTAAQVRALINTMYATCHNEQSETQLQDLAVMSGMAMAALSDYAALLEAEETKQ